MSIALPELEEEEELDIDLDIDLAPIFADLWAVIVWNDDVNSFEHVIECFMKFLGHDEGKALKLAMQIDETGKAAVAIRPKDEAEMIVHALLDNQLQATLAKA